MAEHQTPAPQFADPQLQSDLADLHARSAAPELQDMEDNDNVSVTDCSISSIDASEVSISNASESSAGASGRGAAAAGEDEQATAAAAAIQQQKLMERFLAKGVDRAVTTFGTRVEPHEVTVLRQSLELNEIGRTIAAFLATDYSSKPMLVAHFNYYCAERIMHPQQLLAGEFCIYPFSLRDGLIIEDGVYGLIDCGNVPLGLRAEAKDMATHNKLPMVDKMKEHYGKGIPIYQPSEAFIGIDTLVTHDEYMVNGQPCIFVSREQLPIADRCLKYLKAKATEGDADATDNHNFRLLPLSMLLMHLGTRAEICLEKLPGFENEGAAERLLDFPKYSYSIEIACQHHQVMENRGAVDKCCKTVVCRQIYNILQFFCFQQHKAIQVPSHKPALMEDDVVDRKVKEHIDRQNYRQYKNKSQRKRQMSE